MSLPVFGMSVITNCGLSDEPGDHEDVQRQGRKAGERMGVLFREMIRTLWSTVPPSRTARRGTAAPARTRGATDRTSTHPKLQKELW